MKEVLAAGEKILQSFPEDFRDMATIRVAEAYLQFGGGHGLRTPRARAWLALVRHHWYRGVPMRFSDFAEGLFEGFNFNFRGLEKLTPGGEMLVVNQPNTGPLRGNWFKFLVNLGVAVQRNRQGNYEARWVQKEGSDKPVLKNSPLDIQKRRLSGMINRSCNTILVDPSFSNRGNLRAVLEMRKHLNADGVLVICPEGRDSSVLTRGRKDAGELISMLVSKMGVPVRPVGVWNDGDNLRINFGGIIEKGKLVGAGQNVADSLMRRIAGLLPQGKRGIYG